MPKLIFFLATLFLLASCGDDIVYSPKPRGFPKITYPERSYQLFDKDYCNFQFEYPVYADVNQDKDFFEEAAGDPCWFDLSIEQFDAKLHCSYYPISKDNSLEKLKNDAFVLANKHNVKANFIDELPINKSEDINGFLFSIEGPVATPLQFYLTDGKNHFMRGSLYFETQSRPDSLAPVVTFVREDVLHLINTFSWH